MGHVNSGHVLQNSIKQGLVYTLNVGLKYNNWYDAYFNEELLECIYLPTKLTHLPSPGLAKIKTQLTNA